MTIQKHKNPWRIPAAIAFAAMVAANILANALPLNGQNTGQVADRYPNLFIPAPYTFGIWGLIYLMLLGFTLFQFGLFHKNATPEGDALARRISLPYALTSLLNGAWIFAWHYNLLELSMLLTALLLAVLLFIRRIIPLRGLTAKERLFIQVPFSIYAGWVTVAVIANATALLVGIGWDRFGLPETAWTVIILLVGALIATVTMLRFRDIAYGLVPIWAYIGILVRRLGAQPVYPEIILALIAGLVIFAAAERYLMLTGKKGAAPNQK